MPSYRIVLHDAASGEAKTTFEVESADDERVVADVHEAIDHTGEIAIWEGERLVTRLRRPAGD